MSGFVIKTLDTQSASSPVVSQPNPLIRHLNENENARITKAFMMENPKKEEWKKISPFHIQNNNLIHNIVWERTYAPFDSQPTINYWTKYKFNRKKSIFSSDCNDSPKSVLFTFKGRIGVINFTEKAPELDFNYPITKKMNQRLLQRNGAAQRRWHE